MWPQRQLNRTPQWCSFLKFKELLMTKIYRFTEYRISHLRNRRSGLGGTMLSRRIDHLHNLRLQLDRRLQNHPSRYKRRKYYQPVPRYTGGYDLRGKLPATINHLVDNVRAHAEPAKIIVFKRSCPLSQLQHSWHVRIWRVDLDYLPPAVFAQQAAQCRKSDGNSPF